MPQSMPSITLFIYCFICFVLFGHSQQFFSHIKIFIHPWGGVGQGGDTAGFEPQLSVILVSIFRLYTIMLLSQQSYMILSKI